MSKTSKRGRLNTDFRHEDLLSKGNCTVLSVLHLLTPSWAMNEPIGMFGSSQTRYFKVI